MLVISSVVPVDSLNWQQCNQWSSPPGWSGM
jgi:hypothetical protein